MSLLSINEDNFNLNFTDMFKVTFSTREGEYLPAPYTRAEDRDRLVSLLEAKFNERSELYTHIMAIVTLSTTYFTYPGTPEDCTDEYVIEKTKQLANYIHSISPLTPYIVMYYGRSLVTNQPYLLIYLNDEEFDVWQSDAQFEIRVESKGGFKVDFDEWFPGWKEYVHKYKLTDERYIIAYNF